MSFEHIWLAQAGSPDRVLGKLLAFFVRPEVTWLLATGIVLFGILVWARLRFGLIRKAALDLEKAHAMLAKIGSPEEFTARSEEIYRALRTNPVIGSEWEAFCDHLVPSSDKRTPIRRTREAEFYFNENVLSRAGVNIRFYNAFSGYLLGLGLLFTFFGLVVALYTASMAMDASPEMMETVLKNLLAVAAFKFVNSIAGLGSSMFFSWQVRHMIHGFQLRLDAFSRTVNERVPSVSSEMLLAESAAAARLQTEALQKIPGELAVAMLRMTDPLATKLEEVTGRIAGLSQEAVGVMVREFRKQLAGAADEELAALVRGVEQTRIAIEKTNREIFAQVAEGAARVEASFRNTALQLEGSLRPLGEQVISLQGSFIEMDGKMKSHLGLFTEAMDGLRGVLGDFRTTAAKLGEAGEPLAAAAQDLTTMSQRFQETNTATVGALEQLSAFSRTLGETAQQTRTTWDAYRDRFEKVDDDLKAMVDQLGTGFTRHRDMVDTFVRQIDQSMTKSTQALGVAVVELNDTLERIEAHNEARNEAPR